MLNVPWFTHGEINEFPPVREALSEPDGLLAVGGDLSPKTLVLAYEKGIFPWFEQGQPILWWSPSVRAVLTSDAIYISKNMKKLRCQRRYQLTADCCFAGVIRACAARRETWITPEMQAAYFQLYRRGVAHSIEVYNDERHLVGGLYGVFVKNIFCGESMFSYEPNTSKLALIALGDFLANHGCHLIDGQLPTAHLSRMGAVEMSREIFVKKLATMSNNHLLTRQNWERLWQSY